jgi:LysR family carnitine catabolism transcriptional activator
MTATLRHLKCFAQVADRQSISKAAADLHVSQSALTLTIQQLESFIGLRLFDRTTRSVALTSGGEDFLPMAKRLIDDFDSALGDMRALGERGRGHVSIAVVPSIVALVMPQVMARFAHLYPSVSVHLREDSSGGAEQRVLSREADFGISSPVEHLQSLKYTALFEDRFAVVYASGHPLGKLKRIRWKDLAPYQVIGFSQDSRLASQISLMQATSVPEQVRKPRYQVSHTTTIRSLVDRGLGISVMPSLSAKREPLDSLQCRLLEEPTYRRQVCLIEIAQRGRSPAAQALLELILAELPSLASAPGVKLYTAVDRKARAVK